MSAQATAVAAGSARDTYNYKVVRQFAIMTVVWGIVGMLVGVLHRRAAHVSRPHLRHSLAVLRAPAPAAHQRGDLRLRRLARCSRPATTWSSAPVTRGCSPTRSRPSPSGAGRRSSCGAAITLPLGITTSKEYAELEWPIDVLITLVWVAYAIVFFGTIAKRKTPHIYVANWFFGAFILTVALLHLVNSAEIPVSLLEVLLGLCRRAGRHGAVVVRAQRGRLLPDRRASWG